MSFFIVWFIKMPSSLRSDNSSRSLIPPTPESDITDSPHSPHFICNPLLDDNLANHDDDDQPAVPQKRKAGRKPLYKTAQERRDRNRRAQLAFRARRSDYLARLEDTCRSLEKVVVELQESNRATNDALSRERTKVKYLERMLRAAPSTRFSSPQQPQQFADVFSFPPADSNNLMSPAGQQGVSFPSSTQLHSLISLEQQISQSSSNQMHPQNALNLIFPDNYLGMLPVPPSNRTLSPSLLF